jgi:hypothetical protein
MPIHDWSRVSAGKLNDFQAADRQIPIFPFPPVRAFW